MNKQIKKLPSALKHGGFAGTTILPGEDKAAFDKLHQDLIDEFAPQGPAELDIVMSIARLMWRKQNLRIYRLAGEARALFLKLLSEVIEPETNPPPGAETYAREDEHLEKIRQKMTRAEWRLSELPDAVTIKDLLDELAIVERLDSMIDRNLKRLLMVRGVKSLSVSAEHSAPQKRLSAV